MELPPAAAARLDADLIAWLTTVTPSGQPQTSPVWFLRRDDEFLVYSLDDTARVRNIGQNAGVSLHLDGNGRGGDIVTLEGQAAIDRAHPPAAAVPEYMAKYRELMEGYGWSAEKFSTDYPVPIRIRATRIRAW